MKKVRFVILDRDGVINEDSSDYIKSPEEWKPLPGSLEAIADLTLAGYQIFIATNQSGIARGKFTLSSLKAIHLKMVKEVERLGGRIIDIRYCKHHPKDQCKCRKPKPGMLLEIAKVHRLDLKMGHFVGDSMRDLQAAKAAGCNGVLVLSGNGEQTLAVDPNHKPVHADLATFSKYLLSS